MNIFYVPSIKKAGAWVDNRDAKNGGADWRGYRTLKNVRAVCLHHTVTNPTGNYKKDLETVRYIHMEGVKKWGGIGYNFLITSEVKNGFAVVVQNGDIASVRAGQPNEKGLYGLRKGYGNVDMISISVVGQLHLKPIMKEQLRSLNHLVKELLFEEDARFPLIKSWSDITLHKLTDATACPGNLTVKMVQDYKDPSTSPTTPPPVTTPPQVPSTPVDDCEKKLADQKKQLEDAHKLEMSNYVKQRDAEEFEALNKLNNEKDEECRVKLLKADENKAEEIRSAVQKAEEEYLNEFLVPMQKERDSYRDESLDYQKYLKEIKEIWNLAGMNTQDFIQLLKEKYANEKSGGILSELLAKILRIVLGIDPFIPTKKKDKGTEDSE